MLMCRQLSLPLCFSLAVCFGLECTLCQCTQICAMCLRPGLAICSALMCCTVCICLPASQVFAAMRMTCRPYVFDSTAIGSIALWSCESVRSLAGMQSADQSLDTWGLTTTYVHPEALCCSFLSVYVRRLLEAPSASCSRVGQVALWTASSPPCCKALTATPSNLLRSVPCHYTPCC